MDQDLPESYRMASDQMRRFFATVKLTANELLQHHLGLTSQQAENELGRLLEPAFENALNGAMAVSWTIPVQPDWLLDFAARWIWVMACALCENDVDYPEIPGGTRSPAMHNGRVPPSPEHLARIQEDMAKQATITPQQPERHTQLTEAEKTMRAMFSESTPTVRPIQVNQATQGSQASFSAGRDDQSSGNGTASSCSEADQELEEDAQEIPGNNSLERSTASTPADASGASHLKTQAVQETEQDADKTRADLMAKARKAIFKVAKRDSNPDPVLNYRLDVSNADPEVMAILWDAFEVAKKFPTSEGFTCTGRPWEVKIHRSSAKMFFGDGFCDKDAIHAFAETPGVTQLYAHFEGNFLHIGVTTQKNTLSVLGEKVGVAGQIYSAKKAFVPLAEWARNLNMGIQQSFTDYTFSVIREELASRGVDIGKSLAEFKGEEVAAPSTSADEEEATW